ncbi:uncharacterized protein C18orf63 homolog [Odontesthes bonariensis]|uniref:uncharacterized protein C18orf63 homolog n=1 Tax=Odontesthes bonariensis TaxID=219752 RepID=UPI003F586EC5
MSGGAQKSLFFLRLPELRRLVCVTLTLQEEEDEELRSKQLKLCRELVLLYADVLACPALDSFSAITAVMAIQFFQRGILQAFAQRNCLQADFPQSVFPGDLQRCLSYALITRLSPRWNKAGLYLICGKDFLTERGRLNAVSMELSTSEGQLCFSIEASAVRLPPTTLEDFELPPVVLRRFCSDPECVLDPSSTGGTVWCHVLPSMKKGQIITISRQLPRNGPFRTYRDLQNHWSRLYGYSLPELEEEEVVYCSIFFRPVGEKLFTYPLSCVRLQPVQRCSRLDLQGALGSFLSDVRGSLQSVCGFPAQLTSKPRYRTVSLSTAASVQVLNGEQINLTTSVSIRPVLSQPPAQTVRPSFGLQLPAWAPFCQPLQNRSGFGKLSQGEARRADGARPSVSFCSASSSSLPDFLPASLLPSSFPSVLPPAPPPPQIQMNAAPKLLPIFRNQNPSRHINVALLKLQKQKEQLGGGGRQPARVTLPAFVRKTPAPAASLPRLPPIVPRFSRRPKPQPALPNVTHISSLSPASKRKPGIILAPRPEIQPRSKSCLKSDRKHTSEGQTVTNSSSNAEEKDRKHPAAAESTGSTKRVVFKLKSKKSTDTQQDVEVEEMARSNQLSKLSSAALLLWLKQRGVVVGAKHRKEELMMKVMSSLAEA